MTNELFSVILWYLLIGILGVVALPITVSVCRDLPDRGYSISKILGLLLTAYIAWLISHLFGFTRSVIFFSLVLLCVISGFLAWRSRLRIDRKLLFRNEVIFGSVFLFFLVVRAFNPDIHGGEKVSDIMLLNSIVRTSSFPPQDAWLSGFRIDSYYYFGSYVIALLTKLTGIPSHITFNLGMAVIPALAAIGTFGIGYNLTRSEQAAIVGMFLLVFAGNLFPAGVIAAHALGITASRWGAVPPIMDYWGASRVIPHTINEFPYFSFIFGDLHAHVIAIPFVLLSLLLMLNFYRAKSISILSFVLLSLSIGSLFVFNTWDYPTYAALFLLVLSMGTLARSRSDPGGTRKRAGMLRYIGSGISVIFAGLLMFLLYFISFQSSSIQGIKPVMVRTELITFLVIYNLFLFLIISFLVINLPEFKRKKVMLTVLAVFGFAFFFFPNFQALSVFIPLGGLAGITIYHFYKKNDMDRLFVSILIIIGLSILVFCELFYFDDPLSAPWERMNTVFKYYIQVWILWSAASAFAFHDLYQKKYRLRNGFLILFALLVALNSLYLVTGTYAKTDGFSRSPGLDGLAFMKKTNYADYDAIYWVNTNITGTPVLLEAPGSSFKDTALVSAFTGLPTVIGWVSHEFTWRSNWYDLSQRTSDVDTIYNTADVQNALGLLRKYSVSYVYVGGNEVKKYQGAGLNKFLNTTHFELVYRGGAEIYRVLS